MSKSFYRLVVFLLISIQLQAQKKNDFETIYQNTSEITSLKEMPEALHTADSLFQTSTTSLDKVKTLMLSANLYQQTGNFKKSVGYAERAHALVNTISEVDWQFNIMIFLAAQYRQIGLYEKSKRYITKSWEAAKKIKNPDQYNKALGILNQELAYYEFSYGNFHEARDFLNKSLHHFKQSENLNVEFPTAASYELLGDIYFKINDIKNSEINYRISEKMLAESSHLLGLVYSGLGAIRIKQKNWKEAYFYVKKSEGIAEKSVNPEIKKTVYATINDYYEGIGDEKNAAIYAKKYLKAFSGANSKNDEVADNGKEIIVNKSGGQISIAKNVIIIVLCSALIGSFLHFRTKQRKQRAKLRHIIRSQQKAAPKPIEVIADHEESSFTNISVEEVFENNQEVGKKRNESLMTSETETKLLELLNDFEKGSLYNNKNMSLPFLAGELNTNTKYLSYVINQHKSSDFKTYINRLRINYIVDKLINDDKYRQYKISILADECGFSSHSKFASVFKIVTDYSPSAYIKLLDSDHQVGKSVDFRENNYQ